MNIVGIIAEYNPMHNGHIYHIQKAKELTNADYVIVIMSGSFTEQGNISVINKLDKAKIAIENGADLVLELPTIYAISSAENFAYGAVNILNSLGCVTHLAFGCEDNNIVELEKIAKTYLENKDLIIAKCKEYLKSGINSAKAYDMSFKELLNTTVDITLPNNILAIEYIKALLSLKSEIKPVCVLRHKSSHADKKISNLAEYASSTSIRNVLSDASLNEEEKLNKIQPVIPQNTYTCIKERGYITNENLWEILRYEILKLGKNNLKNIYEVCEGLENKLYDEVSNSTSYEEYIMNVKSKRYTLSKIKRICIYILLGITKDLADELNSVNYARVLKLNNNSSALLSIISNNTTIPVITKVTDEILNKLDDKIHSSLKLDILATNIATTNLQTTDYTNKIKHS